jgi:hypothetical protein
MKLRHGKLFTVVALVALMSMTALASLASAAKPAAPYEDFAGCPSPAESPFIASCEKFEVTGGHFTLGKRNVPISQPIIVRGGFEQETGNFLYNSEGGIVPVRQQVPGGLIGATGYKWLNEYSEKQLKLYATVELAGQPGSVFNPVWSLPVKIHLENELLGSSCYIGSNANPITWNLTTGTTSPPAPNKPITGQPSGPFTPEASRPQVLTSTNGIYVDNSYAVPGANGCVLKVGRYTYKLDEAVDALYGVPAAAGKNEAVLNFNDSIVPASVVYP